MFWSKFLYWFKLFEVAFGLLIAFFTPKWILPLYHTFVNRALWSTDHTPQVVESFHNSMFAILGATIAGSALAQAFIVKYAFAQKQKWAWSAMLWSLLVWVVPDTAFSLYYGNWPNALFNVGPFLMIIIPLILTKKDF